MFWVFFCPLLFQKLVKSHWFVKLPSCLIPISTVLLLQSNQICVVVFFKKLVLESKTQFTQISVVHFNWIRQAGGNSSACTKQRVTQMKVWCLHRWRWKVDVPYQAPGISRNILYCHLQNHAAELQRRDQPVLLPASLRWHQRWSMPSIPLQIPMVHCGTLWYLVGKALISYGIQSTFSYYNQSPDIQEYFTD